MPKLQSKKDETIASFAVKILQMVVKVSEKRLAFVKLENQHRRMVSHKVAIGKQR